MKKFLFLLIFSLLTFEMSAQFRLSSRDTSALDSTSIFAMQDGGSWRQATYNQVRDDIRAFDADPTGSVMAEKLYENNFFTEDSVQKDMFSGIIRFSNDTFALLGGSHSYINIDTLFWQYNYHRLGVRFSKTFSTLYTAQATGDEKFAREGLELGVSQGLGVSYIEIYKRNISKRISSGNDDFAFTTSRYNSIDSVVFDTSTNEVVVYHKKIKSLDDFSAYFSFEQLVFPVIDYAKSTSTQTVVKVYNITGALLADKTLIPAFSFFRSGQWMPSWQDLSIGGSNIWLWGYMND